MQRKVFISMDGFKKRYFPKEYARNLAKRGEISKLAEYLMEKGFDAYDLGLHRIIPESFCPLVKEKNKIEMDSVFK